VIMGPECETGLSSPLKPVLEMRGDVVTLFLYVNVARCCIINKFEVRYTNKHLMQVPFYFTCFKIILKI
jgi:hypothetical protein